MTRKHAYTRHMAVPTRLVDAPTIPPRTAPYATDLHQQANHDAAEYVRLVIAAQRERARTI